jgi:hypothetical protein
MVLIDFDERFPDEESCEKYLRLKREEEGIICPKCHEAKHYWLEAIKSWQCVNCETRTRLKAGTLMEKTHIPLRIWFTIIHLMTSTKKAFSVLEMQRQVKSKYYEPVWEMVQKIHLTMGKRDSKYKLQGDIEIDEGFYEVVDAPIREFHRSIIRNEVIIKRGRGSQRQAKVLVMCESKPNPLQKNPYKPKRILGFAKMIVMDDLSSIGIDYEVRKAISPTSIVITDAYKGYAGLHAIVEEHKAMVIQQEEAHLKLPWVHKVIANSKRELLGIHHSIGRPYLQNYLNEFTYKLNRRTFKDDLFNRLIVAGAHDTWY